MMPLPLVLVRNCERKPISPRAGTMNSAADNPTARSYSPFPPAAFQLLHHRAHEFRRDVDREKFQRFALFPFDLLVNDLRFADREFIALGRIVSISTARCSSPRPQTSKVSGLSVSMMRKLTLVSFSFIKRSRKCGR
jgi:hypothetical protein